MRQGYYEWIVSVITNTNEEASYTRLLRTLYETEFNYILPMDENRKKDGIALRQRFAYSINAKTNGDLKHYYMLCDIVNEELNEYPCSVLEMMVALAIRCDESMSNPGYGNRSSKWFRVMLDSLGLTPYDDDHFNKKEVVKTINRFMERKYDKNGKGGLFTVYNAKSDMREVEIWYQMMFYFNEHMSDIIQ